MLCSVVYCSRVLTLIGRKRVWKVVFRNIVVVI